MHGALGCGRFAKTKPWRCFGQPFWGGRVPACLGSVVGAVGQGLRS